MAELYCPYCNAVVWPPSGMQPGQSLTCGRCDETFKVQGDAFQTANSPRLSLSLPPPASPPRLRTNRTVALGVLGMMGITGVAALVLALVTVKNRRDNDTGLKRSALGHKRRRQQEASTSSPVEKVAPLNLDGLRYLPRDSDVVAAAHVAEVLGDPKGLPRLKKTIPFLGNLEARLKRLEKLTGLSLEDLDHVVAGARINGKAAIPQLVVVLKTRTAYDEAAVRAKLKARPHPSARYREILSLFRQALLPTHTEGLAIFPDDRTIVLGWEIRPSEMPTGPHPAKEILPAEIVNLLAQRGKPRGPVWVAGHSDDWPGALKPLLILVQANRQQNALLVKVRTFSAWLALDTKATVGAVIRCADTSGAEGVKKYLRTHFGKDATGLALVHKDAWLDLQYRPQQ